MITRLCLHFLAALWMAAILPGTVSAADTLRMAVTTSFHNSGLSDVLLPLIRRDLDLNVQLVVVGTGQALRLGRAGDVDALLVHSPDAEKEFVANGFAPHRRPIMVNDFVVVGPSSDPAGLSEAETAGEALGAIAASRATFVSRGDDSGTHRREIALWQSTGVDVQNLDPAWYRQVGAGMGATLNVASAIDAYTLTDRGSWLNFANPGSLEIVFSGDPALLNQYSYLPVSQKRHPHINAAGAAKLEAWLAGAKGQAAIAGYLLNGTALFTPNAAP